MENLTAPFNNSDKSNSNRNLFELKESLEQALIYWITICVVNGILCLTTVFGNSAILITIWKTSSLHSATNILLTSLAVSDLAVGLVAQPLFLAIMFSGISTVYQSFIISSSFLCTASFLAVTAIGVDRLLALQLHLRYEAVVTRFRVKWAVIFIWAFSAMFSSICLWNLSLFLIALPSMCISFLVGNFVVYLRIYLIVRRHQRQIQQQQQQQQQQRQANDENIFSVTRFKKSALNTFLVYILLLCCYMPYAVYLGMPLAGLMISPSVYITTVTLVFLNSSLNPLLYCWRDREIRTAMKLLLCRWF